MGLVFLFSAAGCNDDAALKALVGSYSVTVERADLAGKSDPDVMSIVIGKSSTMLLLFEVGISTDASGPNPNGLIATLDGMNVKVASQPVHIDYAQGTIDGTVTGDGTIAPDGSNMSIMLHVVPTNYAIPGGAMTLEYTVSGAKM
jgi:hypothetical protein